MTSYVTAADLAKYACPRCDGVGREELADGSLAEDRCHVCDGTGVRPLKMVSSETSARLWSQARTLADVGALMARWLDGELPECFVQDAPPDPETGDIPSGLLADLNRAGYVTETSQPAEDWTTSTWNSEVCYRQRAGVEFLMDTEHLDALVDATALTDLIVTFHRAPRFRWMARTWRWFYRHEIPVTESAGTGHPDVGEECWFGRPQPRSAWKWVGRREYGSRVLGKALANAWQVTVVDPEWGRTDYLWDALSNLKEMQP